jgi:hypothetical protein
VFILAAACSSGDDTGAMGSMTTGPFGTNGESDASGTTGATTGATGATGATRQTPAEETDPFLRSDPPPEGVPDGIFKSTPNLRCGAHLEAGGVAEPFTAELGQLVLVCVSGFTAGETVAVEATGPDGSTSSEDVSVSSGSGIWSVYHFPNEELGAYNFIVTQPTLPSASGRYTLVPAPTPRAVALVDEGPAGTTFLVALAGYTGSVSLYLYSTSVGEDHWSYRATLPPAMVSGTYTVVELPSFPGDPPGLFGVTTDPASVCPNGSLPPCATFEITA